METVVQGGHVLGAVLPVIPRSDFLGTDVRLQPRDMADGGCRAQCRCQNFLGTRGLPSQKVEWRTPRVSCRRPGNPGHRQYSSAEAFQALSVPVLQLHVVSPSALAAAAASAESSTQKAVKKWARGGGGNGYRLGQRGAQLLRTVGGGGKRWSQPK